jgi:hypothetical protein
MTCIVGLVHDGKVYMGGDSAGVSEYKHWKQLSDSVRVFEVHLSLKACNYSFGREGVRVWDYLTGFHGVGKVTEGKGKITPVSKREAVELIRLMRSDHTYRIK